MHTYKAAISNARIKRSTSAVDIKNSVRSNSALSMWFYYFTLFYLYFL